MDFLYKMYNHPNFGLYLFTVISILAILFVIVLILAIRDAKKMKKIEEQIENEEPKVENNIEFKENINQSFEDFAFVESEPTADLNFTPAEEPIELIEENDDSGFEPIAIPTIDYRLTNDDDINFEPVQEENDDEKFKNTIMDSINTEFEEPVEEVRPVLEPIENPSLVSVFEMPEEKETSDFQENISNTAPLPIIEEPIVEEIEISKEEEKEEVAPVQEPKVMRPNQFSSVFVDNGEKKPEEKKIEDVLPKKVEEPVAIPSPPSEEAPKAEALPKFKNIPTPKPIRLGTPTNNVELPTPNTGVNNLDAIEAETYEIK